jgi:hypothetical protein
VVVVRLALEAQAVLVELRQDSVITALALVAAVVAQVIQTLNQAVHLVVLAVAVIVKCSSA